ncbi:MAG: PAS domain-containing sensor histidine kinase [Bacteroidota bacterium]
MPHNSKDAFKVIFEACEEGIIVSNDQGKIVLANQASHQMFGYDQGGLISKKIEDLIPERIRKRHVAYRKEYDKQPTPRQMGAGRDLYGLKKNRSEFPIEISLNRAILKDISHTVAFIVEISARKKIEEALKRSEEQLIAYASELENKVMERTEQLDKTIEVLEKTNHDLEEQINVRIQAENDAKKALERERELNELKSRFVSMASHEFRTPLSTMLSSVSLIERYNNNEQADKRGRHVKKIKTAIGNLKNILDDFLSLSKLEEGKISINKSSVNVSELAENVIDQMSQLTGDNQRIRLMIKGKECVCHTDNKIVNNVLINLISNGIKYSEKDVDLILTYQQSVLKIEVRDYGMGIPEQEKKHMFERFFRAKNAVNIQGTGLGLNIVKKYVEILEGTIDFESTLNKGTTFTVCLPIDDKIDMETTNQTYNEKNINY